MRKKPSNHLKGSATKAAWWHSWDLSPEQIREAAAQHLAAEKNSVRTVTVEIPIPDAEERASFASDFSALRKDVTDNFGHRVPRLVPVGGGGTPLVRSGRGAPQKLQEAYRVVVEGEPDLDAGVDGWEQPADTSVFPVRGLRMSNLLATINRVEKTGKVVTRCPESSRLVDMGSGVVERVDADGVSVMMRDTLTASPAISRALQRMIEDGFVAEARQAGEAAMEPIARKYEETFRGERTAAKVSAMLPHTGAGHYHYDLWQHATFLASVEVAGKTVPARMWDGRAGCHHGPGPGVTFWTRHMDTLGDLDELAKTEPAAAEGARYTKMVCDQNVFSSAARAKEANAKAIAKKAAVEAAGGVYDKWIRPADDHCRDIRITRAVDAILAEEIGKLGLAKDYVALGREEYREHLIEAYKAGNTGLKMDTVAQLETAAGVAARAEARVRGEREAAEAALLEARKEKEEAARLRTGIDADKAAAAEAKRLAEKDRRLAGIFLASADAREAALEKREKNIRELTAKAGLWDRASALFGRMLDLYTPEDKTTLATLVGADKGATPDREIGTVKRVMARLLKIAGIDPAKKQDPDMLV